MIHKYCSNSMAAGKPNWKKFIAGVAVLASLAGASTGYAGQTFQGGDDKSLSLGFGLRTSFTSLENGAPDGTSRSKTFNVDDARLYITGHLNKMVSGTFNTERDSAGNIVLMDGFTEFAFSDTFNVRAGRLIPPSDRSNLDGPFYLNAWQFPGVVSQYPSLAIGRDNGMLAWGKPMGGKFVYSVGAFTGHNVATGDSNDAGNLLYAGRFVYNFFDAEPAPAYYNASTYYGSKDILTVALVFQSQKNGVGTSPTAAGNYNSWSSDLLYEQKVSGNGVVTVEGAYYKYGLGAVDCGSGEPGSVACAGTGTNVGGLVAGKAYLATVEYMFPEQVGMGKFQPFVRLQKFDRDVSQTTNKQSDLGVNYVMDGHDSRISAVFSKLDDSQLAVSSRNQFILGYQFQY
jgi:hypothetical protein